MLEYFHNFTLIHDDIEDNSLLRRGQPCLHITHGIPQAINMGDTLFCLATQVILEAPYSEQEKIFLLQLFYKNFLKIFEGQGIELNWHQNKIWHIQEQDYLDMIERKTGTLIAIACQAGAYLGRANPEQQKTLYLWGISLGTAYQIQDDILNLTGQEEKYKKEIGGDITEGKRTLMVLHTLNNPSVTQENKNTLKRILDSQTTNQEKILWAISLLNKSGAITYAKKKSVSIISQTTQQLEKYFPASSIRTELLNLANSLITREF